MTDRTGCYGNCIETQSGVMFDLIEPDPASVRIEDIAHSLSMLCRFNGQCRQFYSVAEHSVHVHDLVAREHGKGELAFAALMHDATEAYIGDMTRPLKQHDQLFCNIENILAPVIRAAFGIAWDDATEAIVKVADNAAVRSEAAQLMYSGGRAWGWGDVPLEVVKIQPHGPKSARLLFLSVFEGYR